MKTKEQIKNRIDAHEKTIKIIKSMNDLHPDRKKEGINILKERIEELKWTIKLK